MTPQFLLGVGGLVLAASATGAVFALSQDARRRRLVLRLAECVAPLAPAPPRERSLAERLGVSRTAAAWRARAGRLLGFDAARADAYPIRVGLLLLIAVAPAVIALRLVGRVVGIPLDLATPLAWVVASRMIFSALHARHADRLYRQFPDALAMIVRAVRVGLPIVEAIRVVARENSEPTAREFAGLVAQTAIGVPLDEALREMAERNRLPEYRFFATALSLQSQTGGGLAETLENLADTIRKRVAAKLRGHALAAEARMSLYILGALPLVAGAMLSVVNPGYMAVLFTDPSGRSLLMLAAAMLLGGAFIMRTMIRKSLT